MDLSPAGGVKKPSARLLYAIIRRAGGVLRKVDLRGAGVENELLVELIERSPQLEELCLDKLFLPVAYAFLCAARDASAHSTLRCMCVALSLVAEHR